MGWVDDDGKHEGWAAAELKDGRHAGTYSGGYVLVKGITGNYPVDDLMTDYERVPDDDVTGWRVVCGCGWKGATFIERKPGESTFVDDEAEDDIFYPEWRKHIEPFQATYALQNAYREQWQATRRLNEAVGFAREAGVSWADIGLATRMSKQAAHERWGGK